MYGSPEGLVTSGVTVIESPDPSARFGSAFGWIHATTTSDSAPLIGAPGYDDGAATDAGAVYFYPLTSPGFGSASRVTQRAPAWTAIRRRVTTSAASWQTTWSVCPTRTSVPRPMPARW